MAFWSGEKLEQMGSALVSRPGGGFDKDAIDCNAITLHIGAEYYRTADANTEKHSDATVKKLDAGEWFVIPSGQFAFIITSEEITVPKNAMAFISMKSSTKWEGLVNISGFHVDPGYQGKLIYSVYNAAPSPIKLHEGMPLFLIWYADLDRESGDDYVKPSESGKNNISKQLIRGLNSPVLSLHSLSEEIAALKNDMKVQRSVFYAGVGFAGAVFVAVFAIALRVIFFPPTNTPTDLVTEAVTIPEQENLSGDDIANKKKPAQDAEEDRARNNSSEKDQ